MTAGFEMRRGKKQCSDCGQWLPESEFYTGGFAKDGLRSSCKTCWGKEKKRRNDEKREEAFKELKKKGLSIKETPTDAKIHERKSTNPDPMETVTSAQANMRRCSRCRETKPVNEFNSGQCYCKNCQKDYSDERMTKRKEEIEKQKISSEREKKPEISEQTREKPTPIPLPGEKPVMEKAPGQTSLFINWLFGKKTFDVRDFIKENKDKITEEQTMKIIIHQIHKCRLLQLSATEFKIP